MHSAPSGRRFSEKERPDGTVYATDELIGSPALQFEVGLVTGAYTLWLYGAAPDAAGDSVPAGLENAFFASMMTVWLARPVKMTPALKFALGSMFGFVMGGVAGLIQANMGLKMCSAWSCPSAGWPGGRLRRLKHNRSNGSVGSACPPQRCRQPLPRRQRALLRPV